jgi:hypothetical protein
MFPTWVDFYFLKTFKRHNTFAKICKSGVLKKVWEKGVGFGAGEKDLSSKGLFHRPNSLNRFYLPLSGTALL